MAWKSPYACQMWRVGGYRIRIISNFHGMEHYTCVLAASPLACPPFPPFYPLSLPPSFALIPFHFFLFLQFFSPFPLLHSFLFTFTLLPFSLFCLFTLPSFFLFPPLSLLFSSFSPFLLPSSLLCPSVLPLLFLYLISLFYPLLHSCFLPSPSLERLGWV